MFDRAAFLRPIAHRGLHDARAGVIENSGPAFLAAIERGYGIECDVRPAADGTPMVFHDLSLARLVDAAGETTDHSAAALSELVYRGSDARILALADLLDMVRGRVPLLVEVKSEWTPPDQRFLGAVSSQLDAYDGAVGVMSFDPVVVAAIRALSPRLPRGIVSGRYDETWWPGALDKDRQQRLSDLIECGPAAPDFFAYHVGSLPTPVTRFLREGLGLPLFAWTVRTPQALSVARAWADAPIFEDIEPGEAPVGS